MSCAAALQSIYWILGSHVLLELQDALVWSLVYLGLEDISVQLRWGSAMYLRGINKALSQLQPCDDFGGCLEPLSSC
ncbi:hypothetical protein VTJ04DRAFT_10781 [Mycothermus thermophilus]|uniref:uncharacterized protein n=1 Tax=Humicola insolens TaxID=85995 RepID=UPI0037429526